MSRTGVLIILSPLLFLTGCLLTRSDIKTAEERKVMNSQLQVIQKNSADQEQRFNEIESKMRELSGKAEDTEVRIDQHIEDQTAREKKSASDSQALEQKLKAFEEALADLESKNKTIILAIDELNQIVKMLREDFQKMKDAQIEKAKVKKKEDSIPKGNYSAGEYYLSKKQYKLAIGGYKKYREINPKGKRYVECTYKIGYSFELLGLKEEAKLFYKETLKLDPENAFAKKAAQQLKKLK